MGAQYYYDSKRLAEDRREAEMGVVDNEGVGRSQGRESSVVDGESDQEEVCLSIRLQRTDVK